MPLLSSSTSAPTPIRNKHFLSQTSAKHQQAMFTAGFDSAQPAPPQPRTIRSLMTISSPAATPFRLSVAPMMDR